MINRQSFQSNNCFRYIFIIFVLLFFLQKSFAQIPPTKPKYEPDNPFNYKHMDLDRWLYIPSGLLGSVGSMENSRKTYLESLIICFNNFF